MSPYVAALSARFRVLLRYRAAALAGIVTQVFFGFVRIAFVDALYASTGAPQPLSHDQARAYIWLTQAFLLLGMLGVDPEIASLVRSGNVASDLLRPVDLHSWWMARVVAGRAAPTSLRCLPILVLAIALGQLHLPTLEAAPLVIASLALAVVLGAALYTLVTASLFWTISGEGMGRLVPAIAWFALGIVVPLPLLPDWLQPLLRALPFAGMLDTPVRIWLGHLSGADALAAIARQVAWITTLVVAGRVLVARGVRRLVVQGG